MWEIKFTQSRSEFKIHFASNRQRSETVAGLAKQARLIKNKDDPVIRLFVSTPATYQSFKQLLKLIAHALHLFSGKTIDRPVNFAVWKIIFQDIVFPRKIQIQSFQFSVG